MIQPNYQEVATLVLDPLSDRQREVLSRRFGLENGEKESLQKIGDSLGITRERVRQIEKEALSKLNELKNEKPVKEVFSYFKNYFKKNGKAKREDIVLMDLGSPSFYNYVYFFLHLGDSFYRFSESEKLHPFWTIEKDIVEKIDSILNEVVDFIKKEAKPLEESHLKEISRDKAPLKEFFSFIEISKEIEQGPLGHFGLAHWPEIKPRAVKDIIYLTLLQEGKPLHFTEIANIANKRYSSFLVNKKILPQTVHNELIKDSKFVLVGRGIYALSEWGYKPGTVKDLIVKILKDSKKPLAKKEIIEELKKQRLVKENTILLNLANRSYFTRDKNGYYNLKSAEI